MSVSLVDALAPVSSSSSSGSSGGSSLVTSCALLVGASYAYRNPRYTSAESLRETGTCGRHASAFASEEASCGSTVWSDVSLARRPSDLRRCIALDVPGAGWLSPSRSSPFSSEACD